MNERLLELYRQARVSDTFIDPSNNMPCETTSFSAEKFAELIIKECTGRLRDIDWNLAIMEEFGDGPTCANDVSLFAAIDIEEHFGIKSE